MKLTNVPRPSGRGRPEAPALQIVSLEGPRGLTERLREMGFYEGARVEVQGRLPFGGPWLVSLGATSFALREEEAACAIVRVVES